MPAFEEEILSHFQSNKDRLRVLESASNGSWIGINRGKLTRYAKRRLPTIEDAEDAVQEAYTRALQFQDTFKEGTDFDNWFFIILTNVINKASRDDGLTPAMEDIDENVTADDLLIPVDEPQHAYALDEWSSHVDRMCRKMKERDASILKLYFIYGHTAPAVSQLLDANLATVLRVIHENRKRIVNGGC